MITIADGRFSLPNSYQYSKDQHVYLNMTEKTVGLDQIGFAFLKDPTELTFLVEKTVKVGEPFVAIVSKGRGITTLNSPCSGTIAALNPNALREMAHDTYSSGYLLKFDSIDHIDPGLITGDIIEKWALHEVRSLLKNEYSFKIIEIGDSATGKTAIKVRFTDNYFKQDLKTTLGVDFGSKEIKCHYTPDDLLFSGDYRFTAKMNVWDSAGQTHYDKIRGIYYRDAKGALLCFDVNNPVSFQNLDKWREELEENLGNVPTILVGNKSDLEAKVSRAEAEAYAKKHNFIGYVEWSAKSGEHIDKIFEALAIAMYKREENLA